MRVVFAHSKYSKKRINIHNTWWAVNRSEGREHSIFLIRSFALSDIRGQGSESKSISPFNTASNIPCWVSGLQNGKTFSGDTDEGREIKRVLAVRYTCPKWRHSTKQYVQYDTRCPHICFRPIMFEENLRSNIVWAADYISENLTWGKG